MEIKKGGGSQKGERKLPGGAGEIKRWRNRWEGREHLWKRGRSEKEARAILSSGGILLQEKLGADQVLSGMPWCHHKLVLLQWRVVCISLLCIFLRVSDHLINPAVWQHFCWVCTMVPRFCPCFVKGTNVVLDKFLSHGFCIQGGCWLASCLFGIYPLP